MAKRISHKAIMRELRRITENLPADLLKNLMKKETIAPTMKQVIEKALGDPNAEISPEQRQRFQNLLDAGVLDRQIEVIDRDGEAAIAAYFDAEIALAVKLGRLPQNAPMPDFIRKKGLQYARRQKRRLEQLFDSEERAEEGTPGEDR